MANTEITTLEVLDRDGLSTLIDQMESRYAPKTSVPTKVSDLTNDSGFQTGEQVTAAINAKISSVYKPGGSVAFADLPELTEANLGLVVNVTDAFTTTDAFVDGAGKTHSAGTNVAVVQIGDAYKYDVLAGFVDLSSYATSESVAVAKSEAITQADKNTDTKLADYAKKTDFKAITAEEITAMFTDENAGA